MDFLRQEVSPLKKRILIVVLVFTLAAGTFALFGVQVEVSSQRTEQFVERQPYTVEILTPLKYTGTGVRNFRQGWDVWDHQIITIRNDDTATGAFRVQCRFLDQRGGVLQDTESVTLAPGEAKTVDCAVDTYQADKIRYSYDVLPPNKAVMETKYRDVPRTRVVTDTCSKSLIDSWFGGSC